ncbi:hypothetical protein MSIMFI_05592 [Mycobacterium simulans]|nr:hypothetical protein MSIMFI_05592 [Mycobacterium simulans]
MPTPDTIAAVPSGRVLVLYNPDAPEPKFSTPEPRVAALKKPEPPPARMLCAWLPQPDMPAPKLPNPDPPPAPALKKPDDGVVVAFPNPGTAGTVTTGISIGPMRTVPSNTAGTALIVKPLGNNVKASKPPDRLVTPAVA